MMWAALLGGEHLLVAQAITGHDEHRGAPTGSDCAESPSASPRASPPRGRNRGPAAPEDHVGAFGDDWRALDALPDGGP